MDRRQRSDVVLYLAVSGSVGLLYLAARMTSMALRFRGTGALPGLAGLLLIGLPLGIVAGVLGWVVVRGLRQPAAALEIENLTDVDVVVVVDGVAEDHECRRLAVAAGSVLRHELDPGRLALCVGSRAAAIDAEGVEVARLDQPLCANSRWIIRR